MSAKRIDSLIKERNILQSENAALKSQRDELLYVVENLMESYNKYGHLLNFDVNIAREAIEKLS